MTITSTKLHVQLLKLVIDETEDVKQRETLMNLLNDMEIDILKEAREKRIKEEKLRNIILSGF